MDSLYHRVLLFFSELEFLSKVAILIFEYLHWNPKNECCKAVIFRIFVDLREALLLLLTFKVVILKLM